MKLSMSTENDLKPYPFYISNAAAMRDALSRCEAISYLPEIGEQQCVRIMRNIIAEALYAPARNCDKFADAETARRAWLDDEDNWDEFGSPNLELHEWLFATAKKKGEQS